MSFNVFETSIADLQHALSAGTVTSVDLVAQYLHRIARYDRRETKQARSSQITHSEALNSIPLLNPTAFDEAAASDARRTACQIRGSLDGIPYTLKDSMKYAGMTCASGSPAFAELCATEDCHVAAQLRAAGAVCIGRTNTPPMMASGMHRGVYGRAESPYNLEYLTAAFSSGSSNGCGTSTAASFAAFGLGSETVSSGRSPASNNALVAYTPSRGVISPRGVWPLYPTCDVLVPMTRTVEDMLAILGVLTVPDETVEGDFWREQSFVRIPQLQRPQCWPEITKEAHSSLEGKRIAVPKMYIGHSDSVGRQPIVSEAVVDLWKEARKDLEALGATVIETDFPLVTNYEDESTSGQNNNVRGFTATWNSIERGKLIAYAWGDFLTENKDPRYPELSSVDPTQIFPRPRDYIPDRFMEWKNQINYPALPSMARERTEHGPKSMFDIPGMAEALPALEAQRKRDLEDWMDGLGVDVVVFPSQGDVGRADVDTNEKSAEEALQNGVKYSNGNRAIRHMGVPTVSCTMGMLAGKMMPVNLTFAGKSGQDVDLLMYAYAYEQKSRKRVAPPLTPALNNHPAQVLLRQGACDTPAVLTIKEAYTYGTYRLVIRGTLTDNDGCFKEGDFVLALYVDGEPVTERRDFIDPSGCFEVETEHSGYYEPKKQVYGGHGKDVRDPMVVLLARSRGGVVGKMINIFKRQEIERQQQNETLGQGKRET